jgi:hypothetical protein
MTTARGLIVPHPYNEATVQQLQTLFNVGVVAALSDCELLEKFTRRRGQAAEAAFAVLVERHGSMVLRVCRGIVGNEQDAQGRRALGARLAGAVASSSRLPGSHSYQGFDGSAAGH